MKNTKTDWDDRALETALREPQGESGGGLVDSVLNASPEQRAQAVLRVRRAGTGPGERSVLWSVAAVLLLGASVAFTVWWLGRDDDGADERQANDQDKQTKTWYDRVEDKARLRVRYKEELSALFQRVKDASVRQCRMTLDIPPKPAFFDFDHGMDMTKVRFANVKPILEGILRAAKNPLPKKRKDFRPDVRLVLHLNTSPKRNVHVLVQLGKTLRVVEGTDFALPKDASFSKVFLNDYADSTIDSMARHGIATVPSMLAQKVGGEFRYAGTLPRVHVLQCTAWEDLLQLSRFTKLRELRVSHSPKLAIRELSPRTLGQLRRDVLPKVKGLWLAELPFASDESLAGFLAAAQDAEEIALQGSTVGLETCRALASLSKLRSLMLTGAKGLDEAGLQLLAAAETSVAVIVHEGAVSAEARARIDRTAKGRIRWMKR